MSFEPTDYIRHIMAEVNYLVASSHLMTKAQFMESPTFQRAFIRSLEVIGEAAKGVSIEFRQLHPDIDWRGMAGMRDRLIHGYFGVDLDLVWDVVSGRIPDLQQSLQQILE